MRKCRQFGATQARAGGSDVEPLLSFSGTPRRRLRYVYGHVIAGAKERTVAQIDHAIAVAQARKKAAES